MASNADQRLKGFLVQYLERILSGRNTNGGPYRYWIQNTDERGYIGVDTVLNANVMRRSQAEHDRRHSAGYFREKLLEVLSEPPFELDASRSRWRYRGGAAATTGRYASYADALTRAAAAPAPANVWAAAGERQARLAAMTPLTNAAARAGEFVPGVGVRYNEWNARAPHKSAEEAFEARSVFTADKTLPPINIVNRPALNILPLPSSGGKRKKQSKTKRRRATKKRSTRRR